MAASHSAIRVWEGFPNWTMDEMSIRGMGEEEEEDIL
jgi:hypothetical protein